MASVGHARVVAAEDQGANDLRANGGLKEGVAIERCFHDLAFARRFAGNWLLYELGVPVSGELTVLELGLGEDGGDRFQFGERRFGIQTSIFFWGKEVGIRSDRYNFALCESFGTLA